MRVCNRFCKICVHFTFSSDGKQLHARSMYHETKIITAMFNAADRDLGRKRLSTLVPRRLDRAVKQQRGVVGPTFMFN